MFQATRYCGVITKRDLLWSAQLTIVLFSGPLFSYLAVSGGSKAFYFRWWFIGLVACFLSHRISLNFTKWWGFQNRNRQIPKLLPKWTK